MKIFIASEFKCTIYKNEYYLAPKVYMIYKRYADFFGKIILCSRIEEKKELPDGYRKVDFIEKIIKEEKLFRVLFHINDEEMCKEIKKCDLVIGRIPSMIGYRAFDCAKKLGKKYFAECMGDAWDSYWNHSFLGKIIAGYMFFKMKSVVKNSDYVLYVTERFLQNRYPNKNITVNASNVILKNLSINNLEKRLEKIQKFNNKNFSIMTVAGVNVKAKGHRFVIKAIAELKKIGINVNYYLIGNGDQTCLKKIIYKYKVENQVHFLGELTLEKVYENLDLIDIYIQPSLQEGLPRAVIEAMSRGCPCLGSNTAGIPELLDSECIFKRKSVEAIVQAVIKITQSDMKIYAINNFNKSKLYLEEKLNKKRNDYFNMIYKDLKNYGKNKKI